MQHNARHERLDISFSIVVPSGIPRLQNNVGSRPWPEPTTSLDARKDGEDFELQRQNWGKFAVRDLKCSDSQDRVGFLK